MATASPTITTTETNQTTRTDPPPLPPTLVLGLNPPIETGPRVRWAQETVDNEHLNKKKSKCCCIYTKPHDPETNNEQDKEFDNCEHCRFHTEKDYSAKPEERQPKIKIVVGKPQTS